jgi:hypothetical protein
VTAKCTQCDLPVTAPVPETWIRKHPELEGLCLDCLAEWQLMHEGDS